MNDEKDKPVEGYRGGVSLAPPEKEQESDEERERFIVKFNNCGFTHYVGPFATREGAMNYPAHLAVTYPKETVFVEVFELKRPVHYGPSQKLGGPQA